MLRSGKNAALPGHTTENSQSRNHQTLVILTGNELHTPVSLVHQAIRKVFQWISASLGKEKTTLVGHSVTLFLKLIASRRIHQTYYFLGDNFTEKSLH